MDKQNFYNELLKEEKILLEEAAAINEALHAAQVLLRRYSTIDSVEIGKSETVLSDSNIQESVVGNVKTTRAYFSRPTRSKNTINGILEALEFLEEGTAEAVGKTFAELNPNFPKDKIHNTVKNILSKLNLSGKITAEKVAGKNYFIYKFKKEANLPLF